ncbi:MAG TPA: SHOCT domain-containing protein [Streptosporangiaceae bacterium]|nr:SHOCT domain-containing protein [Streptosporangiaceae bacterium]
MFVRRRPLLRAAVVGGGAYMVGKRSAEHSAQEQAKESEPPQAGPASVSDQLRQLSDLHAQGSLTDAEFASAKSRLLGQGG